MDEYSVQCRWCHAPIGEPCRNNYKSKKVLKYTHIHRHRDVYQAYLDRRRLFRERYLALWLTKYGDIFQE